MTIGDKAGADWLAALANERTDAMLSGDTERLESLLDDRLVYIHSSARLDTKRTYIESIANRHVVYRSIECVDVRFIDVNDTTSLRTGRMLIAAVVKGDPKPLDVAFIESWTKEDEVWRMISFQSTPRAVV